jgi:ABC-type Fe3+/spermidine/putrescine transport system ATPase subunit
MKDGKIVQEAAPKELYDEPANSFAADFIGRANLWKANVLEVDEKGKSAKIEVPEIGATLICRSELGELRRQTVRTRCEI